MMIAVTRISHALAKMSLDGYARALGNAGLYKRCVFRGAAAESRKAVRQKAISISIRWN